MTKTEAERLAAAIGKLRPDWRVDSLFTFLSTHLADRPYRDVAVALAWVAVDPKTKTPARVLEAGAWWQASMADAPTPTPPRRECPDHPGNRAIGCRLCATTLTPPPESLLRDLKRTFAEHRRQRPPRTRRATPPTDLAAARQRADQETR